MQQMYSYKPIITGDINYFGASMAILIQCF